MKKLILTLAVAAMGFAASAQFQIGATGGASIPLGDFGDGVGTGFGGGGFVRYFINEKMAVGITTQFGSFAGEEVNGITAGAAAFASYSASFDYYFAEEGFKPFASLDLGYCSMAAGSVGGFTPSAATGLYLAPTIGAAYGLSDNFDVLLNVKYNYGMTAGEEDLGFGAKFESPDVNAIGINLGIAYKFGN